MVAMDLIANHLWQSTIFGAGAALVALMLKNNRASVRFWVWFAASIKFLIPFAVLMAIGDRIAWQAPATMAGSDVAVAIKTFSQPFAFASWFGMPPRSTELIVLVIWLTGCAVVLLSWWIQSGRLAQTIGRASLMTDGRELEILRRVAQRVGRHGPITLFSTNAAIEPGIVGIVNPFLLWPRHMSAHLDDRQIEAIMAHELWHVRRRDNLLASLHMLAQAIFWFHPLLWWLRARLVHERELACDEEVIRLGSQPRVYAESILKTCEFCLEAPLMNVAGVTGSDLKTRIQRIMSAVRGERLTPMKKFLLVLIVALAIAVPFLIGVLKNSTQPSDETGRMATLIDQPPDAGGPYRAGNGVEVPTLTYEVKPQYTPAAMSAGIQGTVLLECVVRPDGTAGEIRVIRSLDTVHGLDQAALDAARQWRFKPGTRQGKPVPVLVTIEIAFTLK
jgi:bla regulator protein BlaR1